VSTTSTLSSSRLQARFGKTPCSIRSLTNLSTGTPFCRAGTQSFLIRIPGRISDPVFLTRVESTTGSGGSIRCVLTDPTTLYRVELCISRDPDGVRFDAVASGPEPLWMVEWRISGLDVKKVIVPALGGQALGKAMPAGTTLSYKYPFWWNAQFLIGETEGGGFWFRTKEVEPRFKLVRLKKSGGGFDLSYGFEAEAPLGTNTLKATWYLDCYKGNWKVPVDVHRSWLEPSFGLTKRDEHPGAPPWMHDINFVLELWGIGKEHPQPLHTFEDMNRRLRAWAALHSPQNTLVYVPGYAEHGIDSRAPDYAPSRELGGDTGFRTFVGTAHRMGYRVMIHTNVLAMTFDHPLFEHFRAHQVVDAFDRTQGWGLDIDGDWLAEPYFAYINPGAKEWGDLMEKVIGGLVGKYNLDGVFLDQTLLAFNVSRGPNFVTGMREHIRRLQRAMPGVLFAGEGLHEQVLAPLAMAQIHGIDSIAEVHGMEGRARWRTAHPVSTYLFSDYTRFTAHLLTKHPSHPMFALQESSYAKLGVIPALCLYNKTQPMDTPATRAMIRRANHIRRR